jgi:PhoH-like ATPase
VTTTRHGSRKTFLLDTNVILHDSTCLQQFQEHDIVISITVLEELDRFKKGNESINFHAREFLRTLDELSAGSLLNGGVRIAPGKGRVAIRLERPLHEDLRAQFPAAVKPDHRFLNLGFHLARETPSRRLIVVSMDVNLRL